jgi:hypothetical protein
MIIGICGLQSSGKDTVGDYLINNHGFKKLSFAEVLKDILSILFSWDRKKLEGLTFEDRLWREKPDLWWSKELNIQEFSPRYAMQFIGTDLFREHFKNDIWVIILKKRILELSQTTNLVITDCRFPNEINMLRNCGAKIIHIYRSLPDWFINYKLNKINESDLREQNIHPSEYSWIKEKYDHLILNSKSLRELYEEIDLFCENI